MIILPRFDNFTLQLPFFSLFMIIFVVILARKRDIKLKYRQKSSFFCYFMKSLQLMQNFFSLNKFPVPTPNIMGGLPCDYSTWKVLNMKNFRISDPLTTHWSCQCIDGTKKFRTNGTMLLNGASVVKQTVGLTIHWS